jgi:hypothetical protein
MMGWFAGWFYIGNDYTFKQLIENLITSFLLRWIGFSLPVILAALLLLLFNYFFIPQVKERVRIMLRSILIGLICSLIGTAFFFIYGMHTMS